MIFYIKRKVNNLWKYHGTFEKIKKRTLWKVYYATDPGVLNSCRLLIGHITQLRETKTIIKKGSLS